MTFSLKSGCRFFVLFCSLTPLSCSTTYAPRAPTNQILQSANQEIRSTVGRVPKLVSLSDAERKGAVILGRLRPAASTLCRHLGDQNFTNCQNWSLTIDNSSEVNAYSVGGNQIIVNKGIFEYSMFEDEVALVIAHELAHDMLKHRFETQTNAAIGAIVGGIVGGVLAAAVAEASGVECNPQFQECDFLNDFIEDAIYAGAESGLESGYLFYSREQESEADLIAAYLLSLSGYSLIKAREFITYMGVIGSDNLRSEFNDTHPSGAERLAAFSNIIDEVQTNLSRLPR